MKAVFTQILFCLIWLNAVAQAPQAFKYQAVARNASGEVLTSKTVSFRMSILSGSVTGTAVYTETHSGKQTNAFGLVDLEIGKGAPVTGSFAGIGWGTSDYFLKVEMDPNGGSSYQVMGTNQLLSVPYALMAKDVESVSTDVTLTGNGNDASPLKIASQAATSGQVLKWNGTSWEPGYDLTGTASTPGGSSGNVQFNNSGTFDGDTGLSWDNTNKRVGIGIAAPYADLHLEGIGPGKGNVLFNGSFKTSNPGNPPASGAGTRMMWYPDKAAFRVGFVEGNQWDKESIGNYSIAFGYSTTASGGYSTAMGHRATASGGHATAMGPSTTASGNYSTAMGYMTIASGGASTAIGNGTKASGGASTALGLGTSASGSNSTAMGDGTTASGIASTALGRGTSASGSNSTAMGIFTKATAFASTAMGEYNVGGGNPSSWVGTDPLFEIGNGNSTSSHNAVTVLKNGNIGFSTNTPRATLDVEGSMVVGVNGRVFTEIIEVTGTTTVNGNLANLPYPNGYTLDNTRVLSCEIKYNNTHWTSLGMSYSNLAENIACYLGNTFISVYYPPTPYYYNKPIRILLMKVQ